MTGFSKKEIITLAIVFAILITVSVPNFRVSIMRSRDLTRKDDFSEIMGVLDAYQAKLQKFPESMNGKIVACTNDTKIDGYTVFNACDWGGPTPFGDIPSDPRKNIGASYLYISNGNRYQLFGALEVTSDDEFDASVSNRNLFCGNRVCNFGRAYGNTPLDKSLEEYEKELDAKIGM